MPSVIFDLDGTLADTSGDLIRAANSALGDEGVQLDPERDAGTALLGGRAMLSLGLKRAGRFDEARVMQLYPVLLEAYGANIATCTRLYPGAMDAVEALKAAGFAVGICTNKPEALALKLLDALGVRAAFGAVLGADSLPVRKPDPEHLRATVRALGRAPERCCLIGDSVTDRDTARNAGVPVVLVTFGPARDDMAALAPDALLSDYAELPDLAARLLASS